ncbi:MAG: hypothetical protein H0T84_15445 [Tatlockia sp.]|nr:hypothetical protein [Tatlockia sp.]
MKKLLIAALLTASSTVALADSVIVTETKTWKSVPITVNANGNFYTVDGTLPTDGEYYYTYAGYRCFNAKRTNIDVEPTIYHAQTSTGTTSTTTTTSTTGGTDIYCYPE